MQRARNQENSAAHTADFRDTASRLLHFVRENEPLTFPEVLGSLRAQTAPWRLVIAARPWIVLWDEMSEATATLLAHLLSTQKLALQICRSELYDISNVKPKLPTAHSISARGPADLWLPCTISSGPGECLNADWAIAFNCRISSN